MPTFQTQNNIFWRHTILTEAMTFCSVDSYKNGLRIEQMAYLLGENELNTTLVLAHLLDHNILAKEGDRYFLTKEAFEHGAKALENIRMEQIAQCQEDKFSDEREKIGVTNVIYGFLIKVNAILELQGKPALKDKVMEPEPEEVKIKNLPPALRPKKDEPVKESPEKDRMENYRRPLTLENLALERLQEWYKKNNKLEHQIMEFVDVFSRLCTLFSITKDQAWSLLISMEKQNMIKIVPYHGIKIVPVKC
ncbi:MAG: hypothetical protein NT129_00850 [Candidatus Aenigmarchaeota archaeon]|nr:hypothetical protein [Candidatus Aenigmarchaeota archaeon]